MLAAVAAVAALLTMVPDGVTWAQSASADTRTVDGLIVRFRTTTEDAGTAGSPSATTDGPRTGSDASPVNGTRQPKASGWWWPYRPGTRPTRPGQGGTGQGGDDQGGGNSGPNEPTGPAEPTGPTGPTGPTEPTKPADPTKPAEQTEPTEPTTPTDPAGGDPPGDPGTGPSTPAIPVPTVVDVDPVTGLVADPVNATAEMSSRAGVAVAFTRHAADGSVVVQLPSPLTSDEARNVAQRLMADPMVLSVTPDIVLHPTGNDPMLSSQWSILPVTSPQGGLASMNAVPLWSVTRGTAATARPVVVAVLDSGRTAHRDLDAAWLGGYDFVSASPGGSLAVANDGDGRDSDPSDPGNACSDGPGGAMKSNWHGTAVAGVIAATRNNGIGLAGAAPDVRIVPVRVLGRCGGRLSDTLDAMLWAAGLSVPGVPDNPNPAQVINLSLASDESEACSSETSTLVQDVVDRVLARKVLIVAAAGNDGGLPTYPATGSVGLPANCRGVLSVAAHTRSGDLAAYSSYGAHVSLTAPGGGGGGVGANPGCKSQSWTSCRPDGIVTATNSGSDAPAGEDYTANFLGTSAATPHVAAAAALLFALRPDATPLDVMSALTSTARPWPSSSFCASDAGRGLCGSGMVDAAAAAAHLAAAPQLVVDPVAGPFPGNSVVTLSATGRSARYDPAALTWAWRQMSGPVAVVAAGPGPRATVTLPASRSQVLVEARVTDPDGLSTFTYVVLDVNNAPVSPSMTLTRYPVGALVQLSLAGTDPDGDAIRYALIRGPADMSIDSRSGLLNWVAATPGRHLVVVALTDAHGARSDDLVLAIEVESAVTPSVSSATPGTKGGGGGSSGLLEAMLFFALVVVARLRRLRPTRRGPG